MDTMESLSISIVQADLGNTEHSKHVVDLINDYAKDPMGSNQPLPDNVRHALINEMRKIPTSLVFLAYCGEQPAGVAVCFMGFSTFNAKPLINIHDLAVRSEFRGRKIGKALIERVAQAGLKRGCCKLTLEVRQDNPAINLYQREGFTLSDNPMFFMTKTLVV